MWFYKSQELSEIPSGYIGFVYLITNLTNDKKYVGKKNFFFTKTRQVKGKKKKEKVESDWKEYYGSNEEIQKDVIELGSDKFRREILYLCKTKGNMSYLELREQIDRRVLESNSYYNYWISCRTHQKHLKLEDVDQG